MVDQDSLQDTIGWLQHVATRPIAVNGMGLTPAAVALKTTALEFDFPLLIETPDIFPA